VKCRRISLSVWQTTTTVHHKTVAVEVVPHRHESVEPVRPTTMRVFLGTVVGDVDGPLSIRDAKTEALNRAGEKGATNIGWVSVSGGRGPTAMGRAYRCSGG